MADVKYWCSDQTRTDEHPRPSQDSALLQCRKEECRMWNSDLNCPALSLSVRLGGRNVTCYSNEGDRGMALPYVNR